MSTRTAPSTRRHSPLTDREARSPALRWAVHLGVPLAVSLAVHAAVLTLLLMASWEALDHPAAPATENEYAVSVRPAPAGQAEPLEWSRHPLDQLADFAPAAARAESAASDRRRPALAELARDEPAADLGQLGGGFGLGSAGTTSLLGLGGGAGAPGQGGAGFGLGLGSSGGPGRALVWNVKARGSRFAYVVDFSGSIVVAVQDLKRELKRSIGRLGPGQFFDVFIFYSTGDQRRELYRTEAFAPRWQPADAATKRRFFEWIDSKAPQGRTEPLVAMQRALALEPDAVFFFSDGMFDDRVVAQIAEANRRVGARIHCLVFDELLLSDTSGLPRLTDGARRLKTIAEQSQGELKIVTGADLDSDG